MRDNHPLRRFARTNWGYATVVVVITALLMVLLVVVSAVRADAYVVCGNVRTTQTESVARAGDCARFTPKRQARRFRNDKIGDARGFELPPKVKDMVTRKMNRREVVSARGRDWWRWPFESSMCMYWNKNDSRCMYSPAQSERWKVLRSDLRRTKNVTIKCSGLVVIAEYGAKRVAGEVVRKGGAYGFGVATSACIAAHIWESWW